MVFGKKKQPKKKNVTKTFVGGIEQDPEEPEVPTPPPEEKPEQPKAKVYSGQEVYDEGRSVGFQEGMIHAIEILNSTLQNHQAKLRQQLQENQEGPQ